MAAGVYFCSELPGEQPGGDHGVRLRGRPDMAALALHDRVLSRHVAAGEDGRHILKALRCPLMLSPIFPTSDAGAHLGCTN